MQVAGCHAVVTGAARGIGRAIAQALMARGARVTVSDRDAQALADTAAGMVALPCDVASPGAIADLARSAEAAQGPVDIWISNAGFARGEPDGAASAPDAHWQASWDVHVMAHLRAARAVLPGMQARGHGSLVVVASAAGLLSQIGDAAYSATKAAAVSLAQSLAITHGRPGLHIGVVCPLYVATPLLGYDDTAPGPRPNDRVLLPADVAEAVLDGIAAERFLILPHPEAGDLFRRRAADTDRWIAGMQKLRARVSAQSDPDDWRDLHRFI